MKTRDLDTREFCAPAIPAGEIVLFSEPGRVLDNKAEGGHTDVCYQAFHYAVTKAEYGRYVLRSRSGLGDRALPLDKQTVEGLALLDSDHRFFMLYALRRAYDEGVKHGTRCATLEHQQAFVDGRLKKRKNRGQDSVKVWIEAVRK